MVHHTHVHFIFSIRWFIYLAAVLIALIYVIVEVAIESPRNLVSAAGMAFFILVFYITSHNPAKVSRLKSYCCIGNSKFSDRFYISDTFYEVYFSRRWCVHVCVRACVHACVCVEGWEGWEGGRVTLLQSITLIVALNVPSLKLMY